MRHRLIPAALAAGASLALLAGPAMAATPTLSPAVHRGAGEHVTACPPASPIADRSSRRVPCPFGPAGRGDGERAAEQEHRAKHEPARPSPGNAQGGKDQNFPIPLNHTCGPSVSRYGGNSYQKRPGASCHAWHTLVNPRRGYPRSGRRHASPGGSGQVHLCHEPTRRVSARA